jgi:hypothetical protein
MRDLPADSTVQSMPADIVTEVLLLANDAIIAPLLAAKMVHDVRGGLGEAMMAVATVQVALQMAQRASSDPESLKAALQRLQFVNPGCARASTALDAWSAASAGLIDGDDAGDVDLRDLLLALPGLLLLPAMNRLVECQVSAGDQPRRVHANPARTRGALIGLGQHVISRAAEGAHFTCRFVDDDPRVHAIEMAVTECADRPDAEAAASPGRGAKRAHVALLAIRATVAACGGMLVKTIGQKNIGDSYRVTFPIARRAAKAARATRKK